LPTLRSILIRILVSASLLIICDETLLAARSGYGEGDWVSFGAAKIITSIAFDNSAVYFATREAGILRFDRYSERWRDPLTTSDGLPSNNINRIAYDQDQNELWLETDGGVGVYEPTFQRYLPGGIFPSNLERRKSEDFNPGSLFMEFGYTYFPGYVLDPQARRYYMTTVVTDDRYRAWMGFNGLGAAMLNTRSSDLLLLRSGPFTSDLRAVVSDGDQLYTGGYPEAGQRSGMAILKFNNSEWAYYEAPFTMGLQDGRVNCAAVGKNMVWLGTPSGLVQFDVKNEKFKTFTVFNGLLSNYISAVAVDREFVWVGSDNGINLIRLGSDRGDSLMASMIPRDQSFIGLSVYDIEIDDKFIYLGTADGLFYRVRSGEIWQSYNPTTIGGSRDITAILSTPNGLWLGHSEEIVYFNPKDEVRTGYTPPGLANAIINDLINYKDKIFAATDNGLAAIDPIKGTSRLFGEDDGLSNAQVFSIAIQREYLWLATRAGLTRVYIPALRIY